MAAPRATTIQSNGEESATGYAVVELPAPAAEPPHEDERVLIADPEDVPPPGPPPSTGPRNPEQRVLRARTPGIELPDGRPLTKAQRFWIDPELIAAWDEEERRKKGA